MHKKLINWASIILVLLAALLQVADIWPSKPIRFVVGFKVGGQGMLIKGPAGKTYLVTESAWARTSFTNVYIQPVNF